MKQETIGILVMSYGTPESLDGIEAYYTHIRRGRPPAPADLRDLEQKYEAIGGTFPLRNHTNQQVEALGEVLNQAYDGRIVCYQGLKHASPLIEDGVRRMAEDGIRKAVGVVLAPHYSVLSVGGYIKRAQKMAEETGMDMRFVESYHLHPKLITALSQRVNDALGRFSVKRDEVRVIYTAHSLPEKILNMNDPYPEQLMETARAVSAQSGVSNWQFSWQSAGNTPAPWLGPDILDVLRDIHSQEDVRHVLVCPIGFVSDHLEVLYDIDIECAQLARELGMQLERTESLNTDPLYMETLADVILEQL